MKTFGEEMILCPWTVKWVIILRNEEIRDDASAIELGKAIR